MVTEAHSDVTDLLTRHREQLDDPAQALLEHETLDGPAAYRAAGQEPPAPAIDREGLAPATDGPRRRESRPGQATRRSASTQAPPAIPRPATPARTRRARRGRRTAGASDRTVTPQTSAAGRLSTGRGSRRARSAGSSARASARRAPQAPLSRLRPHRTAPVQVPALRRASIEALGEVANRRILVRDLDEDEDLDRVEPRPVEGVEEPGQPSPVRPRGGRDVGSAGGGREDRSHGSIVRHGGAAAHRDACAVPRPRLST